MSSDCLSSHDGFLLLPEPLYFLLDPDQFLLFCCSFDFFSFNIPVLHLDLIERSSWMTCTDEGALGSHWCGAPLLVWVELVAPPFWLEPIAVVGILVGCSWTCGMASKVGCSAPSRMVGRA
jgi:hypothetical protein